MPAPEILVRSNPKAAESTVALRATVVLPEPRAEALPIARVPAETVVPPE